MEKLASTRQLKVAREIQKDLAEIIRAKGMATFGGALAVMEWFQENNKVLRGELGHVVAKQFRIVPELIFLLDTTLDYAEHIEELLKK